MSKKNEFYTPKKAAAKGFKDEWVKAPKKNRNSGSSTKGIVKAGLVIGAGAMIASMLSRGNSEK